MFTALIMNWEGCDYHKSLLSESKQVSSIVQYKPKFLTKGKFLDELLIRM